MMSNVPGNRSKPCNTSVMFINNGSTSGKAKASHVVFLYHSMYINKR